MAYAATLNPGKISLRSDLLARLLNMYDWLATWAERHVKPGEDGQHLPVGVRTMLRTGVYQI